MLNNAKKFQDKKQMQCSDFLADTKLRNSLFLKKFISRIYQVYPDQKISANSRIEMVVSVEGGTGEQRKVQISTTTINNTEKQLNS